MTTLLKEQLKKSLLAMAVERGANSLHSVKLYRKGPIERSEEAVSVVAADAGGLVKRLSIERDSLEEWEANIDDVESVLDESRDTLYGESEGVIIAQLARRIAIQIRYLTTLDEVFADYDEGLVRLVFKSKHKRGNQPNEKLVEFYYRTDSGSIDVKHYHGDPVTDKELSLLHYCALYSLNPNVLEEAIKSIAQKLI